MSTRGRVACSLSTTPTARLTICARPIRRRIRADDTRTAPPSPARSSQLPLSRWTSPPAVVSLNSRSSDNVSGFGNKKRAVGGHVSLSSAKALSPHRQIRSGCSQRKSESQRLLTARAVVASRARPTLHSGRQEEEDARKGHTSSNREGAKRAHDRLRL